MNTCQSAIQNVERITARNEDLLTDYNNKRQDYDRQINAISIPSRNKGDYPAPEAGEHYACDGARHDRHRSECSGKSDGGHSSGSFEWTGEEWTTWGFGPCRKTNARCYIKQDYINGLATSAENKRSELVNLKNGITLTSLPVPNITCCQSMDFKSLSADKISFNEINQTCNTTPQPTTPQPTTNKIYIGVGIAVTIFIFIFLIIIMTIE
jgi:hypothetical protein